MQQNGVAASNLITEESDIDDTLEFLRLLSEISTHTALRSAPTLQFSQAFISQLLPTKNFIDDLII